MTNTNGDVVSYSYDEYGHKVSYTYDAMNRMTSVTGLDGETTSCTYDAAGRRVETKTGSGIAASALTTTYRYDTVGNLLEQATSGASSIALSYSYNKNGYITGEKRTEGGKTTTSSYTYDPLDQLSSYTGYDGYQQTFTYDANGMKLTKAEAGNNSFTTCELHDYSSH